MNKKDFLIISIGIFLTIIAWIVIDIYQIKTTIIKTESIKTVTLSDYEINKKIIDMVINKKP